MVNVAIVGGGIGGLTAACALIQQGFEVNLYEQASEITEVGAGVQLAPNGILQLQRLGFAEPLEKVLTPFTEKSRYRFSDGASAGRVLVSDKTGTIPVSGVHRADLIEMLKGGVPEANLHLNLQFHELVRGAEKQTLIFGDGSEAVADVIIGADGIHSKVRDAVATPSEPVFSGMNAYRGTIKREVIPSWPSDEFQVWMGSGRHFLTFPIRGGDEINFVGFVPAEKGFTESWSEVGDPNDLRAHFAGWDPAVEGLLDVVDRTNWWGLYDREPLKQWSSGRVTLLGDAAHAMLPHVGQGANQAIEDGVVLAVLLRAYSDNPELALKRYEEVRLPRTSAVQAGSRQNGLRYDSQYQDLEQRDREIAQISEYRSTIYDFDVLAELV